MAKITNIIENPEGSESKYSCSVLIFGKMWSFHAQTLDKIVQKVMERDKFVSEDDLRIDVEDCLRKD